MQQTTIGAILDDTVQYERQPFSIYIVRDGDLVLYVGKASSVQSRLRSHLGIERSLPSRMGQCVMENLPQSRVWTVEAYTVEECTTIALPYVQDRDGMLPAKVDVDDVEEALIKLHHPCLNVEYNPDPTPLPEKYQHREAEVDPHADAIGRMLGLID